MNIKPSMAAEYATRLFMGIFVHTRTPDGAIFNWKSVKNYFTLEIEDTAI
jgi:hypothetical protein